MVRKEVWAHLLVYNIVRTVMAQAAAQAQLRPDEISFTGALQTVRAFAEALADAAAERWPALYAVLLAAVASHRVGDRPDRVEPRKRKRRPKHYPYLMQPRDEARKALMPRS